MLCVSSLSFSLSRYAWQAAAVSLHPPSTPTPSLASAIWPTASSDRAVDLWRIKNIKWHYPTHSLSLALSPCLSLSLSLHLIPFSLRPIGQRRRCLCVALWHAIYNLPCMPVRQAACPSVRMSVCRTFGCSLGASTSWPCWPCRGGRVAHVATGNLFFVYAKQV